MIPTDLGGVPFGDAVGPSICLLCTWCWCDVCLIDLPFLLRLMDPSTRRQQLIIRGTTLVAVISAYMFVKFMPCRPLGEGLVMDIWQPETKKRKNNLRFIYHSDDHHFAELLGWGEPTSSSSTTCFHNRALLKDSINDRIVSVSTTRLGPHGTSVMPSTARSRRRGQVRPHGVTWELGGGEDDRWRCETLAPQMLLSAHQRRHHQCGAWVRVEAGHWW
jgi:hypothetical protein